MQLFINFLRLLKKSWNTITSFILFNLNLFIMKKTVLFISLAMFLSHMGISQQVSFTVDTNQSCAPFSIQCTNTSSGISSYRWEVSDDNNEYYTTNLNYTFTNAGDYEITLYGLDILGNQIGYSSIPIHSIGSNIQLSLGDSVCPGEFQWITLETYDNPSYIYFDFGDGDTVSDVWGLKHKYDVAGDYTITLIVNQQMCGMDTITQDIHVTNLAIPKVNIWTENNESCPSDLVKFYSTYDANQYLWNFDDGSTSTLKNPTHVFTSLGWKMVTMTATNLCGNTNTDTIFVQISNSINVQAVINYWGDMCPNTIVDFSSGTSGQFQWIIDTLGTANGGEVQYLFPDTGQYLITLIASNGCNTHDTTSQYINIDYNLGYIPYLDYGFDDPNYNGSDTLHICPNEDVYFNNESETENTNFTWDFGDGSSPSYVLDPVHTYTSTGSYQAKLISQTNCGGTDTVTKIIDVSNNVYPQMSFFTLPSELCPGEDVFFVPDDFDNNFDFASSNSYFSLWFGDGDSLIHPLSFTDSILRAFIHTYQSAGDYPFTIQFTNSCGNSVSLSDTVWVASDTIDYFETEILGDAVESGSTICPYDPTLFAASNGSSFVWNFGDGTSSTERFPFHAFQDTGYFHVQLIATNNCGQTDTAYAWTHVGGNTLPYVWFNMDNYNPCSGEPIQFLYNNGDWASNSYLFLWDFDDGTTSTERNPLHIFDDAGTYHVKFTVTNGCGSDSSFQQILVDGPIINFSANRTVVFPGDTVQFYNMTQNAISYLWDFGDGSATSTLQTPSHVYNAYGTYTVSLIATNNVGCTDTLIYEDYILVSSLQVLSHVYTPTCNGDNGNIELAVSGGTPPYNYTWSNGSSTQDISNLSAGNYSVTIQDNNGVSIFLNFTVTNPSPINVIPSVTDVLCMGEHTGAIDFTITGGISPYSLQFLGQTYSGSTISINNLDTGTYNYMVIDANGCTKNGTSTVSSSGYVAYNNSLSWYNPTTSCNGSDGSIYVDATSSADFYWSTGFSDTNVTVSNLTALSSGNYTVTINNSNGCSDTVDFAIGSSISSFSNCWIVQSSICSGGSDGTLWVQTIGNPTFTYLWSTVETTSSINNLSAGTYFVTITDSVGCSTVKMGEITETPPLNVSFEKTNPSCYGNYDGKVVAHPSGGCGYYDYHWSNGSYSNQILNRNAGTYYVTITSCGCSVVRSVTLENPPQLQTNVISSDVSFTGYSDGNADVLCENGTPPFTYSWSNPSYVDPIIPSFINNLPTGTYYVTVTDFNGCSIVDTAIIEEPVMIPVTITPSGPTTFCEGSSITLDPGSFDSYQWSTGTTSQTIDVTETGTYSVTVSSGNSLGADSIDIIVSHPYDQEAICVVTVDTALNKNKIVWEKTPNQGIVSYNIYSLYGSQYLKIGEVPYNSMSEFIDSSSTPDIHAYRYKISVNDTCGNESTLSYYHQTIYLGASQSYISGNVIVVLDWGDYIDESLNDTIDWYYIYTGATASSMYVFDSISVSFTDFNIINPVNQYYFKVGALLEQPCVPTSSAKANGGPYAQSISNIDDYSINTDVTYEDFQNIVLVYPNPFTDFTTIKFENKDYFPYVLTVYDITGKVVRKIDDITYDRIIFNKDNLQPGYYSFELKGQYNYHGRLIIN